ncbi:hypothetical protein LWM68_15740 [Niabella sp. W65]|nr:hypothetical protein [Niabella sp. W65]MCH7364078.1 hypothetical protein [Niabella sp. W65]ULT39957.1 hypothetical protein KRR40_34560 [Niabella sp. I65]
MTLTCYIIDDQLSTVQLLELYINLHPELKLIGKEDRSEPALKKNY